MNENRPRYSIPFDAHCCHKRKVQGVKGLRKHQKYDRELHRRNWQSVTASLQDDPNNEKLWVK